jgi:hypothetical protein
MKTNPNKDSQMPMRLKFSSAVMLMVLTGCSQPEAAKPAEKKVESYQGRDDTRSLQNADNIGVDGTGIQKKLDSALDKNDQRASDLDAQIDAQTGTGDPQPAQ